MSSIFANNYNISGGSPVGCGYIDCSSTCVRPLRTIDQWNTDNYNIFYESLNARCDSEKTRYDTKTKENFYRDKVADSINQVNLSFQDRLKDILFWKNELEREIKENIKETDDLAAQRDRLRFALLSLDLPTQINMDNSNSKSIKDVPEQFRDQVEDLLLKECCLINSCKEILSKTLEECEDQIRANQARREELEKDLSDKIIAGNLDDFCLRTTSDSSAIINYGGSVSPHNSTPEEWASFSAENILNNSTTLNQSGKLRGIANSVLSETSRDLREMSDRIEMSIGLRIDQVEATLQNLKDNLRLINKEILKIEEAIRRCEAEIKAKDGPLKLAETRLHTHSLRPGVELCLDEPQKTLVKNWELIKEALSVLQKQKSELVESLKRANKNKVTAENEYQLKEQSLFVDRNKFLPVRRRYPGVITLLGYPN